WWIEPALTVVCYSAFVIYASWSVFSGTVVAYQPYVSPFFSTWLGFGLIKVPIIGILIPFLAVIPLGLRGSCYYYRKSYFRSFFWDPPACAIQELKRGRYRGETRFPWVLNNYHRYFLLLSLIVLLFLWVDVVRPSRTQGDLLSEPFQTLTTDVLVIGAGGAGMRAAIEAAAAGARVAVVCKSLLGKAHTVMAEGGIAAALGNVDPDDNWQVH